MNDLNNRPRKTLGYATPNEIYSPRSFINTLNYDDFAIWLERMQIFLQLNIFRVENMK